MAHFVKDDWSRSELVRVGQESYSQDAVLTTSYADDYSVRGYAFQVQRRISLGSGATAYWVFDFTDVAAEKLIFTLPIVAQSTEGLVYIDSFIATSYTGGTTETILNPNSLSAVVPQTVVKSGVTPTGSSQLREYIVGSDSSFLSSGGGAISPNTPKIWGKVRLVIKFVNQETSTNVVSFGFNWYEIPAA